MTLPLQEQLMGQMLASYGHRTSAHLAGISNKFAILVSWRSGGALWKLETTARWQDGVLTELYWAQELVSVNEKLVCLSSIV